jgi:hypothetical protein
MENQWFSSKMIYSLQIVIFHGFSTSILVCPRVGSPLAKLLIQKTDSFFLIRSFNVQSSFRYIIYIYIRIHIYIYIHRYVTYIHDAYAYVANCIPLVLVMLPSILDLCCIVVFYTIGTIWTFA